MKRAFTLIELLVVVLIIGILAAIALPKYQKTVNKSRYARLKPVARTIADAEEVFYLTNGRYDTSADLSNLDVQLPADSKLSVEFSTTGDHDYITTSYEGLNNRYTRYLKRSANFADNEYCEALATDTAAQELCLSEGATDAAITRGGYKRYLAQGTSTGEFSYELTSSAPGIFVSLYGNDHRILTYSDGESTVTYDMLDNKAGGGRGYNIVTECNAQNECTTERYYDSSYLEVVLIPDGEATGNEKVTEEMCSRYPFLEGC